MKAAYPVKTSTWERIIQVWAHRRVIDGAYAGLATVFPPVPITTLGDLLVEGGDLELLSKH